MARSLYELQVKMVPVATWSPDQVFLMRQCTALEASLTDETNRCKSLTIIYFLVKLIKFFSSIILYITSYQLWWIKICQTAAVHSSQRCKKSTVRSPKREYAVFCHIATISWLITITVCLAFNPGIYTTKVLVKIENNNNNNSSPSVSEMPWAQKNNNEYICKAQFKQSSNAPLLHYRTGVESFELPRQCLDVRRQSKLCW